VGASEDSRTPLAMVRIKRAGIPMSNEIEPVAPNSGWQHIARQLLADAGLALVATLAVGLIIASLAAGVITMSLAYTLLGLAWVVAVVGSFFSAWPVSRMHHAIFAAMLAVLLGAVGWYETAHYEKPPTAKEIAHEVSKIVSPAPLGGHAPTTDAKSSPVETPNRTQPQPGAARSTASRLIFACDKSPPNPKPSREERERGLKAYASMMQSVFGMKIDYDRLAQEDQGLGL